MPAANASRGTGPDGAMTRTGSPGARRGGRITSGGVGDGRARRRDGRANRPRAARWRHRRRNARRTRGPSAPAAPTGTGDGCRPGLGRRLDGGSAAATGADGSGGGAAAGALAGAAARRGRRAPGAAAARAAGAGAAFSPGLTKRTRMPAADASADSTTSVTRACWSLSSIFRTSEVPTGSGSPKTTKAPASVRSRTCGDRPTTTPPYRTSVALSTVRY